MYKFKHNIAPHAKLPQQGDGVEMFKAVCKLGLEGIVSKKLDAPYKSGPSKTWLKIKNPNAPAATCVWTGAFEVVIRQAAGIPLKSYSRRGSTTVAKDRQQRHRTQEPND